MQAVVVAEAATAEVAEVATVVAGAAKVSVGAGEAAPPPEETTEISAGTEWPQDEGSHQGWI